MLGELAPKRLALQRTEAAAQLFAPPLSRVASFFRPVIWLLSKSTNGIVRLLGGDPGAGREPISEQELRGLVAAHESLTHDERRLIDEVFAASERTVSEVMLPRTEVIFLEATMTVSRAAKLAGESPHSRYPVIGRSQDDVLGFVHIRDLVLGHERGDRPDRSRTVGELVREIKLLPGSKNVLSALSEMRRERHHLAIVLDEYGGTDGIVTLEDLIEEVIGDIRDEYDEADGRGPAAGRRRGRGRRHGQSGRAGRADRARAARRAVRDRRRLRDGRARPAARSSVTRWSADGYRLEVTAAGRAAGRSRPGHPARSGRRRRGRSRRRRRRDRRERPGWPVRGPGAGRRRRAPRHARGTVTESLR